MKVHFLQSDIWHDFQKQLGRTIVNGSGDGWSYVGIVEHDRFGPYIYVPYGPSAINEKTLLVAVEHLKDEARKHKAYVINIEPVEPITKQLAAKLFKNKGTHRQAHRTIRIDLSQSEDEILMGMNKTRRKQHRNYEKKGLTIAKSNTKETLHTFFELLKISSGKKGFYIRNKSFFELLFKTLVPSGNASFFTATREGVVEVAALVYDDEDTRYYAHVGRELSDNSLQASAPLISYMIMDAKHDGKKFFDLYGISESDDKIDEKSGFTVFKKTFGGEVVEFGGAWEIPVQATRYTIKKTATKLKKALKK